ncbi:hypothetical protein [Acinetobacter baumannii]|uniref:hypothetical protein n=1 Tax=Acinetobacter baumannii TaxID=470 RepID=UPI00321BFFAA
MDKCKEEFEKWFEETHDVIITTQFKKEGERYLDRNVRRSFESWQHQQSKVEELQTQLSLQRQRVKAFEEELTSSRNYGDELQKRVDAALAVLTEYYTGSYDESPDLVVDIEQALKGEG